MKHPVALFALLWIAAPAAPAAQASERWFQLGKDPSKLALLDLGTPGPVVGFTTVYATPQDNPWGKLLSVSGKLRFDCAGRHKRNGAAGTLEYLDVVAELEGGATLKTEMTSTPTTPELEMLVCEKDDRAIATSAGAPLPELVSQYADDLRTRNLPFTPRPLATESCTALAHDASTVYFIDSGPLPIVAKDPRPEFVAFAGTVLAKPGEKLGAGGCSPTNPAKRAEFDEFVQHSYVGRKGLKLVRIAWKPGDVAKPVP